MATEKCKDPKKHERPLAAPIRILDEYVAMRDIANEMKVLRDFKYDCENFLSWSVLLVPKAEPYNERAWRVSIELDRNHPAKPPKVKFVTKIYHPSVGEDGEIKIPHLTKWKKSTRLDEILDVIVDLLETPNVTDEEYIAMDGIAKECKDNRGDFNKKAADHANNNALKRPPEPQGRRKKAEEKKDEEQK